MLDAQGRIAAVHRQRIASPGAARCVARMSRSPATCWPVRRSWNARWRLSSAPPGTLAERLLTALEAGEAAGGDKRGKQSAALKICTRDPYPDLDIRTDDHPDPLAELRRLYAVSQERFAVFRRFLPGTDSPCGVFDRQ